MCPSQSQLNRVTLTFLPPHAAGLKLIPLCLRLAATCSDNTATSSMKITLGNHRAMGKNNCGAFPNCRKVINNVNSGMVFEYFLFRTQKMYVIRSGECTVISTGTVFTIISISSL